MQARYIKIVLWFCALFVVWQLGRSDVVMNSLFLFAAAGVIPGTNVVLNPDQVFWVMGSLLGLAVLLIFWTNLRRAMRFMFGRLKTGQEIAPVFFEAMPLQVVVKPKAAKSKPVIFVKLPKKPSRLGLALRALGRGVSAAFARVAAKLRRHFPRAVVLTTRGLVRVQRALAVAWRRGAVVAVHVSRLAHRTLIRQAIVIGRGVARSWAWLEPRLRLMDYWLGVQFHIAADAGARNETVKAVNNLVKEIAKIIVTARTEIRAALTRVVEK
jgi:hypothetical protein